MKGDDTIERVGRTGDQRDALSMALSSHIPPLAARPHCPVGRVALELSGFSPNTQVRGTRSLRRVGRNEKELSTESLGILLAIFLCPRPTKKDDTD